MSGSANGVPPAPVLDRRALVRSFNRAAAHYERAAHLQRRVRAELLDRLQFFTLDPQWVIDLGAGTGEAARLLQRRFPRSRVLALDIAEGMLRAAARPRWSWRRHFARVCADARTLPLPARGFDLVYSNLMLQWCDRPHEVFRELARVLKPGGVLLFSTFGPDTLHELRSAWAAADDRGHVSPFLDMPQLAEAMMHAGLAEPVMDVEHHRLHYPDVHTLMRELKQLGARNALQERARGLTGRTHLQRMLAAYERARAPQGIPATYEVLFGAAFGTGVTADAEAGRASSEFAVPISAVKRAGGAGIAPVPDGRA